MVSYVIGDVRRLSNDLYKVFLLFLAFMSFLPAQEVRYLTVFTDHGIAILTGSLNENVSVTYAIENVAYSAKKTPSLPPKKR